MKLPPVPRWKSSADSTLAMVYLWVAVTIADLVGGRFPLAGYAAALGGMFCCMYVRERRGLKREPRWMDVVLIAVIAAGCILSLVGWL